MTKYFIALVLLCAPFTTFADTDPIYPTGATDPNIITQVWGLTGYQTPHVAAGATVTDTHGYTEQCPTWYPKTALGSCQVITGTTYYQSRMHSLAQQLILIFGSKENAIVQAPMFAGWIAVQ